MGSLEAPHRGREVGRNNRAHSGCCRKVQVLECQQEKGMSGQIWDVFQKPCNKGCLGAMKQRSVTY